MENSKTQPSRPTTGRGLERGTVSRHMTFRPASGHSPNTIDTAPMRSTPTQHPHENPGLAFVSQGCHQRCVYRNKAQKQQQ